MNKYKLSNLSISLIMISLMNSTLLGILIPFIIKTGYTNIFGSLILSFFVGIGLLFLFIKIFNFLPDKDIFEKIDIVMPRFKFIFYILFAIILFSIALLIFWRLLTFISSEFLVDTPTIFIGIVLLFPITYILFYDFDTLSRFATISVFISFCLIIFNVSALSSGMDFENLKPIIDSNYLDVFKTSIIFGISYFAPVFLLLVIPKNNIINNTNSNKSMFRTFIISFITVFIIIFTIVSVLGISVSKIYTYPSYVVLKNINVLHFIENIENISVNALLFFMSVTLAYIMLALKKLLIYVFKLNKSKANKLSLISFVIPLIVIIMFLLPNESFINRYEEAYITGILYFSLVFISLIIYLVGKIKR